ncbi:MAG: hypothetical protein IPN87_06445 [Saprospiraceae bacterium]|nr:hypothetical protein [Candidatus Brachybacter algidus]
MKLISKCIYTFVLLISLINTSDIYAQAKGSANVVAIPFNIDPDAKERINEMWIRNFVDARLNYNPATYNAMADIVITGIMDRDGNLWFGTNEKGVFFFDGKPGKDGRIEFQNFTTNDGLGSNTAWCSYMDKMEYCGLAPKMVSLNLMEEHSKSYLFLWPVEKSKCTKYLSRQNGPILVRDGR